MTNTRPRRARAAAAALAATAAFASVANAAVQTLVGVKFVTFAWQPATGQPSSYLVSRSLNGGPLQSYSVAATNSKAIPVAPGDRIQISVRASGTDSTGALRVGPASPLSDPVTVLPAPQFPATGRWLVRCASCTWSSMIQTRWLSDASLVSTTAVGLPTPWVVLGHGALGGGERIVWHNPLTGALAVWDWASLTPIPGATAVTSSAVRGVGVTRLDRDAIPEFLVQHTDTLAVSAWSLTASGFRRVAQLSGPTGATLAAARDFDRDGRVDLIWHNPSTGNIDLARFTADPVLGTGGAVTSLTAPLVTRLRSGVSSSAKVVSTADYDGDQSLDLLLRYSDGRLRILYLNRGAPEDSVYLPAAPDDVNRVVVGSRSVDGVPGAEIALQHRPTGEISIVNPTVTSQAARTVVLSAGSKLEALGIGS